MTAMSQYSTKFACYLKRLLKPFQADSPRVPFLSQTLEEMLGKLRSIFIRKEVVTKASSPHKLIDIDAAKKDGQLPVDMIDPRSTVKAILRSKNIPQGFRKFCMMFLSQLIIRMCRKKVH